MIRYVESLAVRARASDADLFAESDAEERANAASHGLGASLALAGLALLIFRAGELDSAAAVFGATVYGLTLCFCFISSTLYHRATSLGAKRALLACDHCSIFLVIAGSYTPIALFALPGWEGQLLLVTVWIVGLAGIVLWLAWRRYLHPVFISAYLMLGWIGFAFSDTLGDTIGARGIELLLVGCLLHMGGFVFFTFKSMRFHHAVWHAASLAGSIVHFVMIYEIVLPRAA